jgi:hypothetical protein
VRRTNEASVGEDVRISKCSSTWAITSVEQVLAGTIRSSGCLGVGIAENGVQTRPPRIVDEVRVHFESERTGGEPLQQLPLSRSRGRWYVRISRSMFFR